MGAVTITESQKSQRYMGFGVWTPLRACYSLSPAFSQFKHRRYSSSPSLLGAAPSHPPSSDPKTLSLLLQGPLSAPHLLQIHGRVFRVGAHQDNLVATRLIGRHRTHLALRVLRHLRNPNIFPFNAAVRVLSESGLSSPNAFSVFKSLKRRSLSPNDFTFSFLLKGCFQSADVGRVRQVHVQIIKSGYDSDSSVCNGLLLAYAKGVRDACAARKLFDGMPDKVNVCSWTCLISSFAQSHRPEEALLLFLRMIDKNLSPEDDTMVGVLSACSRIQEIEKWVDVFSKYGDSVNDFTRDSIDTVLIYLYGKWGKIEKSREVFDEMCERREGRMSVITWNAMIGGYAQNGHPIAALDLFSRMIAGSNPKPNHITLVSMLSACAELGNLDLGRWAHNYLKTKGCEGILESNTILATAFIDMYSKCGSPEEAKEVFHRIVRKDVISFNAMIMGLAMNGEAQAALALFHEMKNIGVSPNDGSFLGLLCACTHAGLIGEGRAFFADMDRHYSVTPKLEHYACFVDLLARAGHIEEALEIVRTMPVEPNGQVWGALLGACLIHSRVDGAREVARRLVDVDPENSAGYVMLSNACAIHGQWGEIADMRGRMRVRGVRKQRGCSWIGVDGVVHEFLVGSTSYPQIHRVHLLLDSLFKEMRLICH